MPMETTIDPVLEALPDSSDLPNVASRWLIVSTPAAGREAEQQRPPITPL